MRLIIGFICVSCIGRTSLPTKTALDANEIICVFSHTDRSDDSLIGDSEVLHACALPETARPAVNVIRAERESMKMTSAMAVSAEVQRMMRETCFQ